MTAKKRSFKTRMLNHILKYRHIAALFDKYSKLREQRQERILKIHNDKSLKMLNDINDSIIPISFNETKDGWFIETNDSFIQVMIIGRVSPKYGDRQDFPTNMDQRFMDGIFENSVKEESKIALCQILYPLNPQEENAELEKARRNIAISNIVQEQKDKVLHQHDAQNDFASRGIYEYQEQLYNGEIRLFHHALVVAVQGRTKKDVKKTIKNLETYCDSRIVQHEIPRFGQAEAYKSMMPTPYVWDRLFKKTFSSKLCAMTSLLRNPDPRLSVKGRVIGINTRTGNPIYFDFDDPRVINGHVMIIAPSGSGKSVELLKDDIRAYNDGDNVIHIVPKKDGLTDHLRVCKALNGQLIKVGHNGTNFNMLQVFFDKSTMDTSDAGYQAVYLQHFTTVLRAIGLIVGSGYSDPQAARLEEALKELYTEFGVIDQYGLVRSDNFERWEDGQFWPNFNDLRDKLLCWTEDKTKSSSMRSSVEALYNNTVALTQNGRLGYLVNNNSLNLSNKMIMADISALTDVPNVQEALTLMIMSIVYTKLANSKPGAPACRTLLTLDEGANLIKNPTMYNHIEKFFREGRSWGLYIKIVSQDLAGFPEEMITMLKTNTAYILLFGNMRPDSVGDLVSKFNLSRQDSARLMEPGKGRGIMIIGTHKLPYANELDEFEQAVILNKGPMAAKVNQDIFGIKPDLSKENDEMFIKDTVKSVMYDTVVDRKVSRLVRDLGVSCKTWYNKTLTTSEYPNGYNTEQVTNPYTGDKTVVFYKPALDDESGKIKGQTHEHYFQVALIAGEMMLLGAEVTTDNNYGKDQKPDVIATFTRENGSKVCIAFEYETKNCGHSIRDLQEKRDSLTTEIVNGASRFDAVMFIGMKDYMAHLTEAVGSDFAFQRGKQFREQIQTLLKCDSFESDTSYDTDSRSEEE